MQAARTPGLAVAVIRHGQIVYARSFGKRSLHGPPVDLQTRFEIGSDTKQFTAAAILQLKERGKLSLDDRLVNYIPAYPHAREITLRELLDQTSGLPEFMMTNHFVHIVQTSQGSLIRIERMASGPLHFTPGSRWEYSNTNYIALGRVIEVASGLPYARYLREHLFAPAGMQQTTTIAGEGAVTDMSEGYWRGLRNNGPLEQAPNLGESWTWSAGDIVSTVGDLAKWDRALLQGKIISPADFALMTTPATLADGKRDDYGFGWWIDPVHGHTDIYHDGDTLGMSSSNNIFPQDDLQIVVLENQARDAASNTAGKVFEALLPWLGR